MTPDDETLREDERWTYRVLRLAMVELADHPLDDELGLARVRQRYGTARENWATAVRALDRFTMATRAAAADAAR